MSEKSKQTLLKYDVPVLSQNNNSNEKKKKNNQFTSNMVIRDILNELLPPREFTENGQHLIQYVSSSPATRSDTLQLQKQLDQQLQQKKAKENGICPIRSELYRQCFDEIIRETTIDCSARGILLGKIRDEMQSTISAYRSLYESALTYGMRKAMQNELARNEAIAENESLREQNRVLAERNKELEEKIQEIENRTESYIQKKEKEHENETAFLRRQASQLKTQLEQMLTSR
ncbi:33 kDa inner dynein arm light chain, axonemal [Histomonas meleagridis]|uniref:33 kDa inner dynein arm light chain, axonemal n=1 Tax=Histomonas meleagridis TaxID=135588 RepID=UPI00355A3268|nr:33 kDa inner dynein arm light chain, axonemal [Histomonas meleagridis]KAH0802022.1 33 kDa inner dynein arm light chain, axonemal [Histomonas meleagridis]